MAWTCLPWRSGAKKFPCTWKTPCARIKGWCSISRTPLSSALESADASSEGFVFVEDGGGKWYGITKEELHRQSKQWRERASLRSLLSPVPLPHVHPDHDLQEALRRLGDFPFLPVVNRANFRKLEGVVGLPDILRAYRAAG